MDQAAAVEPVRHGQILSLGKAVSTREDGQPGKLKGCERREVNWGDVVKKGSQPSQHMGPVAGPTSGLPPVDRHSVTEAGLGWSG